MPISFSREDIISNVSLVLISSICNFFGIGFYFLFLFWTHASAFFSQARPNLPLFGGLFIPTIISFVGGVIFAVSNNDYYSFPLSVINAVNIMAQIIHLVLLTTNYSYCWSPDVVSSGLCSLLDYFLLTTSILLCISVALWSTLAIYAYIRYSQCVDENYLMKQISIGAYNSATQEVANAT